MAYREGQGLEQQLSPQTPDTDVSGALSLIVEAVTLLGNIFPTLVAFKLKKWPERTVTDILIGSLAITDMLAVLLPLPVSLPSFIAQDSWTGGKSACLYYQVMVFWLQICAMLLVTAMAVERFLAICLPLRYKSWTTRARVRTTIASVYTFAFVISCLPLVGLAPPVVLSDDSDDLEYSDSLCRSWVSSSPDYWYQSIFPMTIILAGWLTMMLVLILNACIIAHLTRFSRRLESSEETCTRRRTRDPCPGEKTQGEGTADTLPRPSSTVDRRSLREFSKLVIVVTILFYCTWLPVMVVMTLTQSGFAVSQLVAVYALMSTTLNGLLNPFVYGALSRQYRDAYFRLLNRIGLWCGVQGLCTRFISTEKIAAGRQPDLPGQTGSHPHQEQTPLNCHVTVNRATDDGIIRIDHVTTGHQTSI